MPLIPTKLHAAGDYATGLLLLAAPRLLPMKNRRAQAVAVGTGGSVLLTSAMTDYELGIRRKLPMPAHLLLDALTGGLLVAGALGLRERRGTHVADWLPHALVGVGEIAAAALTERQPPVPARAQADQPPQAPTGITGEGIAAREPAASGAPIAPPPVETPGPSVTPPVQPESETERAERIDDNLAGGEAGLGAGDAATGETLLAREEAAAAAEAAAIGGPPVSDVGDPAMDPVYQAGGGEQDGWEAAEADLVENATHGEGHGQPERDAFSPEVETDRSTAVYGEGDRIPSSEVVDDPATGPGDPGQGPGLAAERGGESEPGAGQS